MVNKTIIIGNLGKAPEVRFTTSGTASCAMNVAASTKWKDRNGQTKEHTEWFRVCTFGKTAEACGQYLDKGSKVYVEGELRTREYQDRDGETKRITELLARDVRFLTFKQDGQRQGASGGNVSAPDGEFAPPDDDIPF